MSLSRAAASDVVSDHHRKQLLGCLVGERAKRQLRGPMRVVGQRTQSEIRPLGARDRLVGEHERQPGAIRQLEDRFGELPRRNVCPLDVLEHDDHGLFRRKRLEPAEVGPRNPAVLARLRKCSCRSRSS